MLLGVRAALAVPAEVVPREAVEHGRIGDREIAIDALRGHPPVQRPRREDVVLDGGLLVRAAVAVVRRPR